MKTTIQDMMVGFAQTQLDSVNKKKDINRYQIRIDEISIKIKGEVASERDGLGKPLFSNETMREGESQKRLDANNEYKRLVVEKQALEMELEIMTARIKIYYFNLDCYKILANLEV